MAQDNNAAQQIFDTIVTRDFDPKALDAMGKPTVNANEADLISFNFKTENKDYGTVVVLINGKSEIEVYYGDNLGRGMERDDRSDWYDFLTIIRNIAKRNLYTFGLNSMNRLKYSMQTMAQLAEGWNGTNKTSYNKQGPAKLIIKHSRALGEGEARFRNIESLFVENSVGERFKMPFRSISGGKAMARHVTEGGNPYDSVGQHICDTVNEIATLGKFIRASKNKAFGQNEDALRIAEDAVKHYADLKRKAKKMISRRGYKDIFASWDPMAITDLDETIDKVREVFSTNTLDTRIEEALPILAKIQEENMKEADVFEQWADRITEGTWAVPETVEQKAELAELMREPLRCGPDGSYATEQLYSLIGDDSLFDDIYELSQTDPDADCRPLVMATLAEFGIELDTPYLDTNENAPATSMRPMARPSSMRPMARPSSMRPMARPSSNLGGTSELAPSGQPTGSTRGFKPLGEDDQLDEMVPVAAAAIWVLKFVAARGAWPVLKWLLKKHAGKIAVGATGAYYMDQGWDWVKSAIGEEYAQMLIDNKFEIGAAVALVLGAVALKKLIEKQGEKFISANESINESPTEQLAAIQKNRTAQLAAIQQNRDDLKAKMKKRRDDTRGVKEDPTQEEPLTNTNQQDLDDEDMTEVTDIDTGKTALKAARDPMLETEKELTRLLHLARG